MMHPIHSPSILSSGRKPKDLRLRTTLLWVTVVTAFLIIIVGWIATKPWSTTPPKSSTSDLQFSQSLQEIQRAIEQGLDQGKRP